MKMVCNWTSRVAAVVAVLAVLLLPESASAEVVTLPELEELALRNRARWEAVEATTTQADAEVRAARASGYWPADALLIEPEHLGFLPPAEALAIATGSQREPRAALSRLAAGNHPWMDLASGDTVIFSARRIPGNEDAVERIRERFEAREIRVIEAEDTALPIHASGHPAREELADMYRWIQPTVSVPVHGEPHHLASHADLAAAHEARPLRGRNGDLFMLAPVPGIRRGAAVVGRRTLREG